MPRRTKILYSSISEGVGLNIRCTFNTNTEYIGIYTVFGDRRTCYRSKSLFSISNMGVELNIQCMFNLHTSHITTKTSFRKKSGWKGGAATNPNCGAYLGCIVAEKVLANVFKNVQQMPNCNPKYDFICGKGFKIDVKASCGVKNYPNSWIFGIRRNKIADYFLCLAFDNRKDLNPKHIWLIPSSVINHLSCATISRSTLEKWTEYELMDKLDIVVSCCDTLKD